MNISLPLLNTDYMPGNMFNIKYAMKQMLCYLV